jgi:hypothetical protein
MLVSTTVACLLDINGRLSAWQSASRRKGYSYRHDGSQPCGQDEGSGRAPWASCHEAQKWECDLLAWAPFIMTAGVVFEARFVAG